MRFQRSYLTVGGLVLVIVAFLIYLFTPTGVYEYSSQMITQIYYADNISKAHRILIDQFNKEYENKIEVVPVNLPFSKFSTNERKELLTRTLRSKSDRIDVFAVDLIWVPRFARWSEPLDLYYQPEDLQKIADYALKSCYFENKLFAVPLYTDVGVMYYRRDLLYKLPHAADIEKRLKKSVTWDEFIDLSTKFAQSTDYPFYIYAADHFEGLVCSFFEGLANQNALPSLDDTLNFNTAEARKALQLLVDLIHKYKITPFVATTYEEFQCYIHSAENNGIFFRGWPGLRQQSEIVPYLNRDVIEEAALPHFKGGNPAFVFGGWNLMLSKYSTKKPEAIEFIKFLHRKESQKIMFQHAGYAPVVKDVYTDSLFIAQEPDLLFYKNLFQNGFHRPYMVDYTKISDILSYYLHQAIIKQLSVSEALQLATHQINSNQVLIK